MIAWFQQRGVDVLCPQHQRRRSDFRKGRRLGRGDHVVVWTKPKRPDWLEEPRDQQLPDTLTIREFRDGRRVLVTTLIDPQQATVPVLRALYQTRWHGELDLRAIQQVLAMDILRRQTPDRVEKEIAVHLPAYNLLRALLPEASRPEALAPRTRKFQGRFADLADPWRPLVAERADPPRDRRTARTVGQRTRRRPSRAL